MEAWISGSDIYLMTAKGISQKANTEFKYMPASLVDKAFGIFFTFLGKD